ncbi:MAG: TorF family putative porin [Woeseia sp.]
MKNRIPAISIATAFFCTGPASAELSANIGWASDYFYRGILQAPSSASAGIDFERNGFYAGSWAADVNDGLEVDGYFGYGKQINDISYSVGFTGYYYTSDFDDSYQEVNFSAGFKTVGLDVAVGEYDNFAGPTQIYSYYALTVAHQGLYGKYGVFSRDFDGEYIELGYGTAVAGIDLSVAAILASSDLVGESTESLVFTLGKAFALD